eukprot:3855025-Pyramimonas_sp.AAC.1
MMVETKGWAGRKHGGGREGEPLRRAHSLRLRTAPSSSPRASSKPREIGSSHSTQASKHHHHITS